MDTVGRPELKCTPHAEYAAKYGMPESAETTEITDRRRHYMRLGMVLDSGLQDDPDIEDDLALEFEKLRVKAAEIEGLDETASWDAIHVHLQENRPHLFPVEADS